MSTSATRQKIKLQCALVSALSLVSASGFAQTMQSSPVGIYGGAAVGVGVNRWDCGGYVSCDRSRFSGKLYGGKYLTPSFAVEVNYFLFGGLDRVNDAGTGRASGVLREHRSSSALGLGVVKDINLIESFYTQMRIGIANTKTRTKTVLSSGVQLDNVEHTNSPYVGLGTSVEFLPDLRLTTSFDYIFNGRSSNVLFSVGATAEF